MVWWMKYIYIPNLHGNHTLCNFRNDCRILKQQNPSEGSDVSSKKREQKVRQQPQSVLFRRLSCCPVTDVFFVKRLESQGNNMLKTLVKWMTKTAEDSVKEAVTRKLDQHILLKVQDTDLAAREAHYHAVSERLHSRGWQTPWNHQRHKNHWRASFQQDHIFSVHRSVCYAQNHFSEIKRLPH